ncbi:MAG: hypothetical protein ACRDP7_17780 [Trebonia sp.]
METAPEGSPVAGGLPVEVVTVPPWWPGIAQLVLPPSYRDLVEVLAAVGPAASRPQPA